ncbi:phosphodiesterase [Blastococcus sp. TBT05-19]|uniref:phosphodiesterase n=1 Tax=Blastococcus sp. TBT05-19 TaxID=2250581 RepID=UPI000DEB1C4A|nr:phosphodiesterase [Blastococcus sp. TBT05-19]RBY92007.1 phosphodiesterase [Blastococcus sp. TBT05-19]
MTDLAALAGKAVAVPLGAIARFRRGRAMHPRGAVFDAVLERHGASPPFGVPWLDEVRSDPVVVRLSRGAGLPAPLPDVLGLAVRMGSDDDPVDILLSSTGQGRLGRLVPVPRVDAEGVYSSIMAFRSAAGPIRFAALPRAASVSSDPEPVAAAAAHGAIDLSLAAAVGSEGWRPFARLRSTSARGPLDSAIRFDAVLNPPPGLTADGPMARFCRPAYATARRAGPLGR